MADFKIRDTAAFEIRDPNGALVDKETYYAKTNKSSTVSYVRDLLMMNIAEASTMFYSQEDTTAPDGVTYTYTTESGYTITYISTGADEGDSDMLYGFIKEMINGDAERESLCVSILRGFLTERGIMYNPNNTSEELFEVYTALDASTAELSLSLSLTKTAMLIGTGDLELG